MQTIIIYSFHLYFHSDSVIDKTIQKYFPVKNISKVNLFIKHSQNMQNEIKLKVTKQKLLTEL